MQMQKWWRSESYSGSREMLLRLSFIRDGYIRGQHRAREEIGIFFLATTLVCSRRDGIIEHDCLVGVAEPVMSSAMLHPSLRTSSLGRTDSRVASPGAFLLPGDRHLRLIAVPFRASSPLPPQKCTF